MSQFPWLLRSYTGSQAVIVMEIAATGGAAARRMVSSVSACGNSKGITCNNCIHDGVESGEDRP